ncbi:hypothetical protein [Plasticicumulans acidivorans]|uniref:Uncharacterized protein n=1 Tax=Plasticicumulans acidivorans TaxID=886464 RepID=A0A317MXP7_9GAMM|nr:hypothetical protein [Plasticicumulans acidivorans]PWV63407.1 hypothetical protein C7443_103334 [Plasticicumulans acidivorans]
MHGRIVLWLLLLVLWGCGEPSPDVIVDVQPGGLAQALAEHADAGGRVEYRVRKREGVLDPSVTDLEILAEDWLFYRRRVRRLEQDGDDVGVIDARARLAQIEHWLADYDPADVTAMKRWIRKR